MVPQMCAMFQGPEFHGIFFSVSVFSLHFTVGAFDIGTCGYSLNRELLQQIFHMVSTLW